MAAEATGAGADEEYARNTRGIRKEYDRNAMGRARELGAGMLARGVQRAIIDEQQQEQGGGKHWALRCAGQHDYTLCTPTTRGNTTAPLQRPLASCLLIRWRLCGSLHARHGAVNARDAHGTVQQHRAPAELHP
ncbi:uncharacterized protein EKO05_0002995 [Ascochyta rabiei]|uniref:uncharacterized protein n=1 Tax=Didymella rabiei TaxID=5454 RepID=UPI0018FF8A35|nr:uncharacterized protein EKO05_0002995 [Ascochyta rabiei]UPX12449.1 hypothetical protein EKO05_0002995 [Ascochyta rabiei]